MDLSPVMGASGVRAVPSHRRLEPGAWQWWLGRILGAETALWMWGSPTDMGLLCRVPWGCRAGVISQESLS